MNVAPELAPERDLEHRQGDSSVKESAAPEVSIGLAAALGVFSGAASGDGDSRLVTNPLLRHPANGEMRIIAMHHAQQQSGNHRATHMVLQMHRGLLQRQCSCGGTCESCRAQLSAEKDEPEVVQRQAAAHESSGDIASISFPGAESSGQLLDRETRDYMEPRFGQDFSDVRIHADTRSAQSAERLSADAYTTGRDIYFGAGKYAPNTREGKHLLAHELTHTVQQKDNVEPSVARSGRALVVGAPDDPLEAEAERTADTVTRASTTSPAISHDADGTVRRQSSGFWDTKAGKFVSGVGSKASDLASDVGQGIQQGWEKTKEAFAGVLEKYAPGAIRFFVNLKTSIADRVTEGFDGLFGGLLGRIKKDGFGSALLGVFTTLVGGMAPALGKLLVGACAAIPALAAELGAFLKEAGGHALAELKSAAKSVSDFFNDIWSEYGAPPAAAAKKFLSSVWGDITKKAQEYWAKLAPVRKLISDAWNWLVKAYTEGKKEVNDFLERIFLKAVEKWQEVKKDLLPYMKYVKKAAGICILIALFGPLTPVVAGVYVLYLGVKWVWDHYGKKWAAELRQEFVTRVLPSILSATEEVKKAISRFGQWLSGIAQDLADAGAAILDAIGVVALLRAAKSWMADLSARWHKFAAEMKAKLAAWTASVLQVCAAVGQFLHPLIEFLRQSLLVAVLGPFAILDDGVWNTVKKMLTLALKVPCVREIGGLMQVPAMLARIEKLRGVLKAAFELIKHPEPVIKAMHDALAPMVRMVPPIAAAMVAVNVFPEEPEHQKGVQRYLEPLIQNFMENWWDEIKKIGWTILWPWDEVGKSFPVFLENLSSSIDALFDLEISLAIDKGLKSLQALNGALGAVWGWFALAAVLIGAALGTPFVEFGPETVSAGAAAGWSLAQTVGLVLMGVAIATELAIIEKAKFDVQFTNKAAGDKVRTFIANHKSYENIAGSIFSLAMMGALVVLGAIIHAVIKEVKSAVRGPKAGEPGAPKDAQPGDRLADPDSTAKPGDFTPDQLNRAKLSLEQKVRDPQNIRPVEDPDLQKTYDAEVELDDGTKARRNRQTGKWCLFRNPRLCGSDYGSDVNKAVDNAIAGKDPLAQSPAARASQIEFRYERILSNDLKGWNKFKERISKLSPAEAVRELSALEKKLFDHAVEAIAQEKNLKPGDINDLRDALRANPDKIADLLESRPDISVDPDETPDKVDTGKGGSQPVEAGKAGVDWSRARARDFYHENVVNSEMAFKVKVGKAVVEVRLDLGSQAADGNPRGIEAKNGFDADFTENQKVGYPVLATDGGIPANAEAEAFARLFDPDWKPGQPMKPFPIRVDYWINGKPIRTSWIGGEPLTATTTATTPVVKSVAKSPARKAVSGELIDYSEEPATAYAESSLSFVQRHCGCGGSCESCQPETEDEEESLPAQRKRTEAEIVAKAIPENNDSRSLDDRTRGLMESHFQHNFSDVRVHTDSEAAKSADALAAHAYTTGRDIYFGRGKYVPEAVDGQKLLAHELTHVVQQSAGRFPAGAIDSGPGDPLELEAERVSQEVIFDKSAQANAAFAETQVSARPTANQALQRDKDDSMGDPGSGFDADEALREELENHPEEGGAKDLRIRLLLQSIGPDEKSEKNFTEFVNKCEKTAEDEDATLKELSGADLTDPEAFPKTWSERLKPLLSMSYPIYALRSDVAASLADLERIGPTVAGEIYIHGIPTDFPHSLDLQGFYLSSLLGVSFAWSITPAYPADVKAGPFVDYTRQCLIYLHNLNELDFVNLWIAGSNSVIQDVADGKISVDPEAFDRYAKKRPGGVPANDVMSSSVSGLPEDLKGRIDPEVAENHITAITKFLAFAMSLKHGKEIAATADPYLQQADNNIATDSGTERLVRGAKWGHEKGFYGAAIEQQWNDIKEHAGEIAKGMAEDVAIFTVAQFIPIVDVIVDIYYGAQLVMDAASSLSDLYDAEEEARNAKTAVALQRAAAHQATVLSETARKVAQAIAMHVAMKGTEAATGKVKDYASGKNKDVAGSDKPSTTDDAAKAKDEARDKQTAADKDTSATPQAKGDPHERLPNETSEKLPGKGEARVSEEGHCKICHSPCEFAMNMARDIVDHTRGTRVGRYAENLMRRVQLLDDAMEYAKHKGTYDAEYATRFKGSLEKLSAEVDLANRKLVDEVPHGSLPSVDQISAFEAAREQSMIDDPSRYQHTQRLEDARAGTAFHNRVETRVVESLPHDSAFSENTIQEYLKQQGVDPKAIPDKSAGIDLYIFDNSRNLMIPVDITHIAGDRGHVQKLTRDVERLRGALEKVGIHLGEPIEIEYSGMTTDQAAASILTELRALAKAPAPPRGR